MPLDAVEKRAASPLPASMSKTSPSDEAAGSLAPPRAPMSADQEGRIVQDALLRFEAHLSATIQSTAANPRGDKMFGITAMGLLARVYEECANEGVDHSLSKIFTPATIGSITARVCSGQSSMNAMAVNTILVSVLPMCGDMLEASSTSFIRGVDANNDGTITQHECICWTLERVGARCPLWATTFIGRCVYNVSRCFCRRRTVKFSSQGGQTPTPQQEPPPASGGSAAAQPEPDGLEVASTKAPSAALSENAVQPTRPTGDGGREPFAPEEQPDPATSTPLLPETEPSLPDPGAIAGPTGVSGVEVQAEVAPCAEQSAPASSEAEAASDATARPLGGGPRAQGSEVVFLEEEEEVTPAPTAPAPKGAAKAKASAKAKTKAPPPQATEEEAVMQPSAAEPVPAADTGASKPKGRASKKAPAQK